VAPPVRARDAIPRENLKRAKATAWCWVVKGAARKRRGLHPEI
jgi:hypothetical protein